MDPNPKAAAAAAPSRDLLFGREKASWWFPPQLVRLFRFFYLAVAEFTRNGCPEKAAALGFETVLSFVPALVLSLFLVRSFGGGEAFDLPRHLLHQLSADEINLTLPPAPNPDGTMGPEVHVKLSEKITEIAAHADRNLRSTGVSLTSFLGLALAAIFLTLTLEQSLNDIWGVHGKRGFLLRVALAWTMLTLGPLLIGLSFSLTKGLVAPVGVTDYVVRMVTPFVTLLVLYKFVPAVTVETSSAMLGAVAASAAYVGARRLFGYYLSYAVGIDRLFGTIGLLPIAVIWIWVSWVIVLLGAEIAYTLQNLDRLTVLERRRRIAPFVQPGLSALGLVLRVGQAFRAGTGFVSEKELAAVSGLPDSLWSRLAALLVEKKILISTAGAGYMPGRPLEQVKVEEVFAAVEEALVARPDDFWPGEPNPLRDLSAQLADARRRELGSRTLAQLLDGKKY